MSSLATHTFYKIRPYYQLKSDIFDTLVNDSPRQYGPSRHLSLRPGRRCWTASPSMDICLPTIRMESENP